MRGVVPSDGSPTLVSVDFSLLRTSWKSHRTEKGSFSACNRIRTGFSVRSCFSARVLAGVELSLLRFTMIYFAGWLKIERSHVGAQP